MCRHIGVVASSGAIDLQRIETLAGELFVLGAARRRPALFIVCTILPYSSLRFTLACIMYREGIGNLTRIDGLYIKDLNHV